jgi:hypothetical protein
MSAVERYEHKVELRRAAELLLSFLVAVAFHEAMRLVSESLKTDGLSWDRLAEMLTLPLVFFLTAVRFFIGNQLHLMKESFKEVDARSSYSIWYFDLMVMTLESATLIFLGTVATLEASSRSKIGFISALIFLLLLDVLWLLVRAAAGCRKSWKHCKPEAQNWLWALLNVALVVAMFVAGFLTRDPYSHGGLVLIGIFNLAAFACDMWLTGRFLSRRRELPAATRTGDGV